MGRGARGEGEPLRATLPRIEYFGDEIKFKKFSIAWVITTHEREKSIGQLQAEKPAPLFASAELLSKEIWRVAGPLLTPLEKGKKAPVFPFTEAIPHELHW